MEDDFPAIVKRLHNLNVATKNMPKDGIIPNLAFQDVSRFLQNVDDEAKISRADYLKLHPLMQVLIFLTSGKPAMKKRLAESGILQPLLRVLEVSLEGQLNDEVLHSFLPTNNIFSRTFLN